MIRFDGVVQKFGTKTPFGDNRKTVLDGVDLVVPRGHMLCLLGPSGAGKTTMVNLIMGNEIATAGTVTVMGEVAPYPKARRWIGYMPQDEALYDDISAAENLRFFGAMNGLKGRELEERIDAMLEFGRLTEHRKKLVADYSGGMKRRLSLGVAMIHDPDLLVLDEPTVGLDPDLRLQIWAEFKKLTKAGKTLLVTTHVMDEAERCDEIAMLHRGKIIALAPPRTILADTGAANLDEAFLVLDGTAGTDPAATS
ncbi:ABC transporter ATP-binding protein [Bifidobacterium sp. BRDM6]|uniref:ABC transporter ATP-binding protein n=2 Tax=Bifidobacterium choloepi TaxID=2614131 RepID=A0A6I5N1E8_9BIFI|nr:ABC transporter ATP-binding protein [Bifidobacterium choloepi]